mmetsp:Transcript_34772/g.75916  ORF Transcript_34772/g.75916 Transcript_34772/m.75916 type:complete len:463 (-) Transcript_34772:394-1782(-)
MALRRTTPSASAPGDHRLEEDLDLRVVLRDPQAAVRDLGLLLQNLVVELRHFLGHGLQDLLRLPRLLVQHLRGLAVLLLPLVQLLAHVGDVLVHQVDRLAQRVGGLAELLDGRPELRHVHFCHCRGGNSILLALQLTHADPLALLVVELLAGGLLLLLQALLLLLFFLLGKQVGHKLSVLPIILSLWDVGSGEVVLLLLLVEILVVVLAAAVSEDDRGGRGLHRLLAGLLRPGDNLWRPAARCARALGPPLLATLRQQGLRACSDLVSVRHANTLRLIVTWLVVTGLSERRVHALRGGRRRPHGLRVGLHLPPRCLRLVVLLRVLLLIPSLLFLPHPGILRCGGRSCPGLLSLGRRLLRLPPLLLLPLPLLGLAPLLLLRGSSCSGGRRLGVLARLRCRRGLSWSRSLFGRLLLLLLLLLLRPSSLACEDAPDRLLGRGPHARRRRLVQLDEPRVGLFGLHA